jgi:hypothetical protein
MGKIETSDMKFGAFHCLKPWDGKSKIFQNIIPLDFQSAFEYLPVSSVFQATQI